MRYFTISLVVLLSIFKQSLAQNIATDSLRSEKLNEIVVTAQYIPQEAKNSVYKIRSIDFDEIRSLGATNLRDLLYYELNLDVFQQGSFSGTGVEIQGISQENIKILVDGVPIVGRLRGTIDLNHIVLDNIERVEIIEGPTSLYYGTDAMGGVINLITKTNLSENLSGSIQSYIESIYSLNISGLVNLYKEKNAIVLNIGRNYFDGFNLENTRKTDWGSREQYFGNLSFKYEFNKSDIKYDFRYFTEELSNLGDANPDNTALDFISNTRRVENNLQFKDQISNYNHVSAIVSLSNYKRNKNTYLTDLNADTKDLVEKQTDTTYNNTFFIKSQFSHVNNNKQLNYSFGFDANMEEIKGARIKNKKQKLNSYGLFASINYNFLENFSLQPGARFTYNNAYGSIISPAIHFKYQINKSNKILISYANGFRSPSINQLYLNFKAGPFLVLGNEDLEAEKSDNYSISSYHEIKLFNRKLMIEPSLFYNDIENLISLGPTQDFTRQYINVDINKTKGGNIKLSYNPSDNLQLNLGFSLLSKYNSFIEDFDTDDFIVTNRLTTTAKYTIQKIATSFNLHFKHNGNEIGYYVDKKSGDLIKTNLNSYNLLDINLYKSFFKNKLDLTIGVKNILNETNINNVIVATGEQRNSNSFLYGTSYFAKVILKI